MNTYNYPSPHDNRQPEYQSTPLKPVCLVCLSEMNRHEMVESVNYVNCFAMSDLTENATPMQKLRLGKKKNMKRADRRAMFRNAIESNSSE